MAQSWTCRAVNPLVTKRKCLARKAILWVEEMRWDITLGRSKSTLQRVQKKDSSEGLSLTSTIYSRPSTAASLNWLTSRPRRLLGVGSSIGGPSVNQILN